MLDPVFQHGGPFWAAAGGTVQAKCSSVTKMRTQIVVVWEADVVGVCGQNTGKEEVEEEIQESAQGFRWFFR